MIICKFLGNIMTQLVNKKTITIKNILNQFDK